MKYKSYDNLSVDIATNIHKVQGMGYDLVVGIPRSGMIPAYMIALFLNIKCTDYNSFISNSKINTGRTRTAASKVEHAWDAEKILLVDDSVHTGVTMNESLLSIPEDCRKRITRLAVYVTEDGAEFVDVFFEVLPAPRIFQWNIFHHNILGQSCVDIDGILCADPTNEENDDGENYIRFLQDASPLYLPTYRIHSLVTNRLEKYRPQTVSWLKKHNIQYDNLIMLDLESKEERKRLKVHALHKASYYNESGALFFIESDERQAIKIAELSGKPVFCAGTNRMCYPGLPAVVKHGKNHLLKIQVKKARRKISKVLPIAIKSTFRPLYKKIIGL